MANRTFVYIKTSAPTVNDDTGDGYKVGDGWYDTTNDKIYKAIDVTAGAAIWHEWVTLTGTQTLTNKTLTSPALTTPTITRATTTNPAETHQTLTDGATVNWNMDSGASAQVTLAGNRAMAAPTNLRAGATYLLMVIQDGTGSRTITWNSVFKWAGGTAPVLSTTAGAKDLISFWSDGTNLYGGSILKAFA